MTPARISLRAIEEAAALARMELVGAQILSRAKGSSMSTEAVSGMWALGDYHAFAKRLVWDVGPELVAACGIGAGDRVLDVAAGTGNVALRAAQAGATVVACDITPEHFDAGRREAAALAVDVEWVEGDAQQLPFADGEFDVVTSSFGAIFAPDHQRVADELLRVGRPGARVGMANFVPDGTAGAFFDLFARYAPAPSAGALPPVLWGTEDHVRELFGDRAENLRATRKSYVERAATPAEYVRFFQRTFGPVIAIERSLAGEPERAAAFEREFLEFATHQNVGAPGGQAMYEYGYLLVVAEKRRQRDTAR